MNKNYKLYFHRDPINNNVIYVGIGTTKSRPNNMNERNYLWHNYVNKRGKPIVEIVHNGLSELEALLLEAEYIAKYGKIIDRTGTLCNLADGGQAGNAGIKWSNKQNKSRSKSLTNRTYSDATKQKMREAKLGKKLSEEQRKKLSKARLGVKQPNISKALMGKKQSQETIEKKICTYYSNG